MSSDQLLSDTVLPSDSFLHIEESSCRQESIQTNYYLHSDNVSMREQDPGVMESLRQDQDRPI
jgi:hypothetical protein